MLLGRERADSINGTGVFVELTAPQSGNKRSITNAGLEIFGNHAFAGVGLHIQVNTILQQARTLVFGILENLPVTASNIPVTNAPFAVFYMAEARRFLHGLDSIIHAAVLVASHGT